MRYFLEVEVGNWKDWKPTKAQKGDVEDLQSNLTPEEVEKLASVIPIDDDDGMEDMEVDGDDTIVVEM
jgi:hypothetical protein